MLDISTMTPVEHRGKYYFKRDDLYSVCGVYGGKSRAAFQIVTDAISKKAKGIVTAGSRQSPQCEIISCICEHYKIPCFLFMPPGSDTTVITNINKNSCSTIIRSKVGYNSVIISDAKKYAIENGLYYVPFGMEMKENVDITMKQVENIPPVVKRIVMPVGSGMSMASVLSGLDYFNRTDIEVLGVQVGKDPTKILETYYSINSYPPRINYKIVKSNLDYHKSPEKRNLEGIDLDPIYESKCIPFMKDNDLLWIVGHRIYD